MKKLLIASALFFSALLPRAAHAATAINFVLQSTETAVGISSGTLSQNFAHTGIKVSLTPLYLSSLMRVTYSGGLRAANPTGDICYVTVERNNVNFAVNDHFAFLSYATSTVAMDIPVAFSVTDTATISGLDTYEVFVRTSSGGTTCTVNNNGTAVLRVDEIAQ